MVKVQYKGNKKDHVLVIAGRKIQFSGGFADIDKKLADKIIKKDDYSIAKQE